MTGRFDIFDSEGRTVSMHDTLNEATDQLRKTVRKTHIPLTIVHWDTSYFANTVFPYVNVTSSEMAFIDAPTDKRYYATIDIHKKLNGFGVDNGGYIITHFMAENDSEAVSKARERGLVVRVFKLTAYGLSVNIPLE